MAECFPNKVYSVLQIVELQTLIRHGIRCRLLHNSVYCLTDDSFEILEIRLIGYYLIVVMPF